MEDLEQFIAKQEKSPDLAAVTRYHLDGLKRALERVSEQSRATVFRSLAEKWCLHCGDLDAGRCQCTNEE